MSESFLAALRATEQILSSLIAFMKSEPYLKYMALDKVGTNRFNGTIASKLGDHLKTWQAKLEKGRLHLEANVEDDSSEESDLLFDLFS